MIDKFIEKFEEFSSREEIEDLSMSDKISLFGIFVSAISQNTAKPTPTTANKKVSRPNQKATQKQIGFLRKLIKEERLPQDTAVSGLTVGEASTLISEGVKNDKGHYAVKSEPEPEPEGNFTGAFNHQSGGFGSSGNFWE